MEARTERKTVRLTKSEMEMLEEKIESSGSSFYELVVKRILNDESNNDIMNTITWESEFVQDQIKDSFKEFTKEYRKDMEEFGYIVTKNLYKKFHEVKSEEKDRTNIYFYEKGDLITTSKNVLMIVVKVLEDTNEIRITRAPLTHDPKFKNINVKEVGGSFQAIYRQ